MSKENITLTLTNATLKFEVEREDALMSISGLPTVGIFQGWVKEILAHDGDILQAYLRFYAALLDDSWAANDLKSNTLDEIVQKMDLGYGDILIPLDGSNGLRLVSFEKSRTTTSAFSYSVEEL